MADKRLVTFLITKGGITFAVGEDCDLGGIHKKVARIAYQGDRGKTVGSAYTRCYTVEFVNETVHAVIPHHEVAFILNDAVPQPAAENGAAIPDLPEE